MKHSAPVGQPTVTEAIVPTSHEARVGYANTETMSASITGNHVVANVEKLAQTSLVEFQSTPFIIKTENEDEGQWDAEYSYFADADLAHADGDLSVQPVFKAEAEFDMLGTTEMDAENWKYAILDASDEEVDLSWSTVVKTEAEVDMSGIPGRDGVTMDYTDADEVDVENDVFMDDAGDHSDEGSKYELDSSTAIPGPKTAEQMLPNLVSTANEAFVTSEGAVDSSPSASDGPSNDDSRDYVEGNCPVPECRQPFHSLHPKGSLWHHLKYMMHRGTVGCEEFEAAHAKVHAEMKRATGMSPGD
jgi:hypothetical protein